MKRWWSRRKSAPILTDTLYAEVAALLPILRHLSAADRTRLRELADQFLRTKKFEGARNLVITDPMRGSIALQACLLVLHLDLALYGHWHAIILYPGDFRVHREEMDEDGVVHQWSEELSGESWVQGPVILSWDATASAGQEMNVVLHEFAHKLDMHDGAANGCPPLRSGMSSQTWSQTFAAAYDRFLQSQERDEMLWLDEYAAYSPAEFFAVLSEMFFLRPDKVLRDLPAAYRQLRLYYGLDPAACLCGSSADSTSV